MTINWFLCANLIKIILIRAIFLLFFFVNHVNLHPNYFFLNRKLIIEIEDYEKEYYSDSRFRPVVEQLRK